MLSEKARSYAFWTLDLLRNNPIKKHYDDIKFICDGRDTENSRVNKHLNQIIIHAVNTTDFYNDYKDFSSIKDFPIIDKNVIKSNYERIFSKNYVGKKLHSMSTSGSTGTPFTIKQDINKRHRVLAEIIYFGEQCNYRLGDRNAFFRVWTKENRKGFIQGLMQNLIMLDTSRLDEDTLEDIVNILKNDRKIKCIIGYASSLDILSKYMIDNQYTPDMFSVKTIISGAELLKESTRENLKKVFGSIVVSRYSNQENGILAQEIKNEKLFLLNQASYFIEFLKLDSDQEAEYGELSRVVITDLFNYAMPMMRYDTGDLAMVGYDSKCGKVITSLEGRKRDFLYDTRNNLISPAAISVNMWKFPEINQYQLIQEGPSKYRLKLNSSNNYSNEQLVNQFKSILGLDANIEVSHVDEIPQLKSGKFQQVICKFNPNDRGKLD